MISWRYHVVSIVAVILAFGLGILAGTSVVGDRFARDLQLNYDEAIGERDAALDMVALQQRFADALGPTLRDGVLTGEEAVVVTVAGSTARPRSPSTSSPRRAPTSSPRSRSIGGSPMCRTTTRCL